MTKYTRKPNTKCSHCSTPVYKRPNEIASGNVYCSKTCYGLATRNEHPCPICSKPVMASKNAKYCSRACANTGRTGTKYGQGQPRSKAVNGLRLRVIEVRGSQCETCGYDNLNVLQVHHIIERANGGTDDMENLKLLCPNCHMTVHLGDSRAT